MQANKQGDYALRRTRNYFDNVQGLGFHEQPITFHEFMTKPESLFMFESDFLQIPGYVQQSAEILPIEEEAREFVLEYIIKHFEHMMLGMQDYVHWADIFRNKCASLAPSFWAQVNMINLMYAKDLEQDETQTRNKNTGGTTRKGATTVQGTTTNESTTEGSTTQDQTVKNKQETDSYTRGANATVVRAEDQLTDEIQYDWSDAADAVQEQRSRNGDTTQTIHGSTVSNQRTNGSTTSESTSSMANTADQTTNTGESASNYTNKMFMQEKQWAIDTARQLMPLDWLASQLRPLFYLIY